MPLKKLIAGNWKMNKTKAEGLSLAKDLSGKMESLDKAAFDLLLCPPATLIDTVSVAVASSGILVGGQDCHFEGAGAHTGDISAEMLKDLGCTHVIVGHSERRANHSETSSLVAKKAAAAQAQKLTAIICVGETAEDRDSGRATEIVAKQLDGSLPPTALPENTVIAYEPVWAIGTGKTATPDDIRDMHAFIRTALANLIDEPEKVRILYGGSVKPDNAGDIFATENVDGALVGGASLKAEDFWGIAQSV